MSALWSSGRLSETSGAGEPDVLFGWMHEDPSWKQDCCRLVEPPSASRQAETSRSRWSLPVRGSLFPSIPILPRQPWCASNSRPAAAGCSFERAGGLTVGEALAIAQESSIALSNDDLRVLAAAHRRPLLAAGLVDARLRSLARWVLPWLVPSGRSRSLGLIWKGTWSLLPWGVRITVRPALRRHLPPNWSSRLRHRFERALACDHAQPSPLVRRLLSPFPPLYAEAFAASWPTASANQRERLVVQTGFLHLTTTSNPVDPRRSFEYFRHRSSRGTHSFSRNDRSRGIGGRRGGCAFALPRKQLLAAATDGVEPGPARHRSGSRA